MRGLRRVLFPLAVLSIFVLLTRTLLQLSHRRQATSLRSQDSTSYVKGWLGTQASPSPRKKYVPSRVGAVKATVNTQQHRLTSFVPLPTGKPTSITKIQFDFQPETSQEESAREERLTAVKVALLHASDGYQAHAWLKDEVAPVTGGYRTTLGGWGVTMMDNLDMMWIMGGEDEFERSVNALTWLDFNQWDTLPLNVFEVTIRYLGGLLSAYDASEHDYSILLNKATELGDMLYAAFDTPNRMPVLHWRKLLGMEVAAGESLLAELGSMSLEFTRLSILTGDPKYYDAIQRITNHFEEHQNRTKLPGLWPTIVNAREVDFSQGMAFTLAGTSDSMYEYLVKEYLLLGGRLDQYKTLYVDAVESIKTHLLFRPMVPKNEDILFSGTAKVHGDGRTELDPQMSHLTCFAGGMFALGAKVFNRPADLKIAKKLVDGCIWAYNSMPSGIMPENFYTVPCSKTDAESCKWDDEIWAKDMIARNSNDEKPEDKNLPWEERIETKSTRLRLPKGVSAIGNRNYLLRPEAIESIFVLYRITGDEKLRDEAWRMFQAITKETVTEIAFSSIEDVTKRGSKKLDRMESYFTAETLKYFFLLFSKPDVVSLDKYVFNTEGHPFIIGYKTNEDLDTEKNVEFEEAREPLESPVDLTAEKKLDGEEKFVVESEDKMDDSDEDLESPDPLHNHGGHGSHV